MGQRWAKNVKFAILARHPSPRRRLLHQGEPESCLLLHPSFTSGKGSFASAKVGLRLSKPEKSSLLRLGLLMSILNTHFIPML